MKNTLFALVFLSFSIHLSAQVVFSVGDTKVTADEFKKRLNDYHNTFNPPTVKQLAEDWIRFEVGVQEAEKLHLQNDPAVRERYRQVLYNALLERALGKKIQAIAVNEADMKAYYKKNPEIRMSHIFVQFPADATPDQIALARKRATGILEDVRKQLRHNRPFADLVKLYSDDLATKQNGGDMGFQSRVTLMPPALYDIASKMKIGQVSGLVEGKQGFHIVKLTAKVTYDEADKRQIRAAVFDIKRAHLFNAYFNALKKKYRIQIDKEALDSIHY